MEFSNILFLNSFIIERVQFPKWFFIMLFFWPYRDIDTQFLNSLYSLNLVSGSQSLLKNPYVSIMGCSKIFAPISLCKYNLN